MFLSFPVALNFIALGLFVVCSGQREAPTSAGRERTVVSTTGSYTELECTVGNSTTAEVIWRVNGTAVQNSTDYVVYQSRGVLVLKKTVPRLQGTYTCELTTNSSVYDTINLSIREGCFPDAFRPFLSVGVSSSVPCSAIDAALNPNSNITWTCTSHLRWEGDFSQCFLRQGETANMSTVALIYRVPLVLPLVLSMQAHYQQRFMEFIRTRLQGSSINGTNLYLSYIGRTEDAEVSTVVVIFKIPRRADLNDLRRVAGVNVPLGNVTATPVYQGVLVFIPGASCSCPLFWSNFEGSLQEGVIVSVNLCTAPLYVERPCKLNEGNYMCSELFTNDPQDEGKCQLDTDADGVPNIIDRCEYCCSGERKGGFDWPDTIVNVYAHVTCSSLHPSFNKKSFAVRKCKSHQWTAVDTSECTFGFDSNNTIVVVEGLVNPVQISESNRNIEEAVEQELQGMLVGYSPLNIRVQKYSISRTTTLATAIVKFPTNVSSDVLNTYNVAGSNTLFLSAPVLYGHRPSDSCPCTSYSSGTAGLMLDTCMGTPQPPCLCEGTSSEATCQCVDPYAPVMVNSSANSSAGLLCSFDSDGDRIPDLQDGCAETYDRTNLCQSQSFVDSLGYTFCSETTDDRWGIAWDATPAGLADHKRCPGGIRVSSGVARRLCKENGSWADPNLSDCESVEFTEARTLVEEVYSSLTSSAAYTLSTNSDDKLEVSPTLESVVKESAEFFLEHTVIIDRPLLPKDLRAVNEFIDIYSEYSEVTNLFALDDFNEEDLFTIVDHILDTQAAAEWNSLNEENRNGASLLMRNVERMAKSFAVNLNTNRNTTVEVDEGVTNMFANFETSRMAISAQSISSSLKMPRINTPGGVGGGGGAGSPFMSQNRAPMIEIPSALLEERSGGATHVSIVSIAFDGLPTLLPRTEFFSSSTNVDTSNLMVGTLVLSTQVSSFNGYSDSLRQTPVQMSFPIEEQYRSNNFYCVFWNYSEGSSSTPGLGGWSRDGIADGGKDNNGASCSSTHLTTFAILVDTTGLTTTINPRELLALELVSYIGCAVSLVCLLLTVLFFLCLRKELIQKVINYVHFNLSIALICGLITFVAGIETAAWSVPACTIVATLLHYFFLAAFSWMLCEGIVLYNLLVKVFGANKRKWIYIFTALGWGIPIPIVGVSVGARWNYYRIPQSYNTSSSLYNVTKACWLSHEYGTIAAFIVPMLAIVVINLVFIIMALRGLYKFKRDQKKRTTGENSTKEVGVALLKSIVILTPLLGFTWVIGLLAVNNYTTVFAWLFCFLNAFQGVFIFFFHVVRSDKVWPKLIGFLFGIRVKDTSERSESQTRFSVLSRLTSRGATWNKAKTGSISSKSSRRFTSSSIVGIEGSSEVMVIGRTDSLEMEHKHSEQEKGTLHFVNAMADIAEEKIELQYAEDESSDVCSNKDVDIHNTSP